MTEATETSNAAVPSPTSPSPSVPFFDAPAGELARFLQLVMAKGGAGDPPFPNVDLTFAAGSLLTEHRDSKSTVALRAELYGLAGGQNLQVGVNAGNLLDYLDGSIFAADAPVRFQPVEEAGVSKVRLSAGRRLVTSPAVSLDKCGRISVKDPYSSGGPDGGLVTRGATTPPAGSPWEAFAENGYVVAAVPKDVLNAILSAGLKIQSHRMKGAEVLFRFPGNGTLGLTVSHPKKADEDQFHIEEVEGAVVVGNVPEEFSVMFQTAVPFLTTLRLLRCPTVTLVHGGGNKPLNIVAVEKSDKGAVGLRLTQNITPNDATAPKK